MARTREQAGRLSRNKGKRFERECRAVMAELVGWPHWKRTQRGDTQHYGDLVACDENGMEMVFHDKNKYYIECRARATLSAKTIGVWFAEVTKAAARAGKPNWLLITKQDRGPTWVFLSWEQQPGENLRAWIF